MSDRAFYLDAWYSASIWDQVAGDEEERDLWLERFTGFSILIAERQTSEEWIAEAMKRWCYRPPVSAHLIDNRKSGPPEVFWGPGPGGRLARRLADVVTAAWAVP